MENIRAKVFIIIYAIVVLILMIFRVYRFYKFRKSLKAKSIELIKLEKYQSISYLLLITSFCMLVPVYFSVNEGQLFFILIFLVFLIDAFTQPQNYFIINSQGFRKSYFRKLVSWDKIESMAVVRQEIFMTVNNKVAKLAFGDRSELNHLLVRMKNFRPDLYDKYLMNLNISG
jgi:hypothetical protein